VQHKAWKSAAHDLADLTSDYKKNEWIGTTGKNLAARDTQRKGQAEHLKKL